MTKPRILAFAYACEPGRGSEPGAGWAWATMLSSLGETWVVTRANNRVAIAGSPCSTPSSNNPRFVYVDLPAWARRWKVGRRGVHLYYLLWQVAALRRARRLHREHCFDVVWHLTFANVWLGTLAPLVGPPFVYGPVGGAVRTPWRLVPVLGWRGSALDLTRAVVRMTARYLNPVARLAWRRAALILVQNPETRAWLPARHRARAHVFPNVILGDPDPSGAVGTRGLRHNSGSTALFAGTLLPLKGVALAIRALALLPGWRLVICGSGPDEARLQRLAKDLGVSDRVEHLGWVTRSEVLRLMREQCDVFVFPSLHDEAGWAVAEARTCGVPVVCLDHGGPPLLGGTGIRVSGPRATTAALASAMIRAAADEVPPADDYGLSSRSRQLQELLSRERPLWHPEGDGYAMLSALSSR